MDYIKRHKVFLKASLDSVMYQKPASSGKIYKITQLKLQSMRFPAMGRRMESETSLSSSKPSPYGSTQLRPSERDRQLNILYQ